MGLEPIRGCPHRILSPMRLPIPPQPHKTKKVEVPAGFEPAITELQSIALPLGYGTISLSALILYMKNKIMQHFFLENFKKSEI